MLGQRDMHGQCRPVGYHSEKLSDIAKRWSVTEKECYALVACIREFRYLIEGTRFIVFTDHKAIKMVE